MSHKKCIISLFYCLLNISATEKQIYKPFFSSESWDPYVNFCHKSFYGIVYKAYYKSIHKYTGCPIIKFTFLIYQFLRPLIWLRDCSVLEIYVFISPFNRTMFEYSSLFTHQILMVQYFKRSWIRPQIILFCVFMFLTSWGWAVPSSGQLSYH